MYNIYSIYFNSRPHKEVDDTGGFFFVASTVISTHDLTRRSTFLPAVSPARFVFQLTTSQGGRRVTASIVPPLLSYFNSRPHKEVDFRGRRLKSRAVNISTHDLTRRSTRIYRFIPSTLLHFNSRPHKEVDFKEGRMMLNEIISTHDLTRRSTITYSLKHIKKLFQLTTSQGGRQQFLHKKFSFQNHFLCSLHIIHSYYINIAFFSTLFLQNLHFFWCESPRIFLFTCLSHSAF